MERYRSCKASDQLYTRSTDNGSTFGPEINLSNDTGKATQPQIAAPENIVYVVWNDTSADDKGDILFAKSTDNGQTFDPEINLSNDTGKATQPQIAVAGGNVYVVWSVTAPVKPQIAYTRKYGQRLNFWS